jgi:uncharacterized protein (DUF924 family)
VSALSQRHWRLDSGLSFATSAIGENAMQQAVLDFWFGDGLALGWPSTPRDKLWWGGGAELDHQISAQFGNPVKQALTGGLRHWAHDPAGRLALVILLDQFTRNVFRGHADAFSGDALAQSLVLQGLDLTVDKRLPWVGRVFFYMPLMHSEDLARQEECVNRFTQLHADAPDAVKPKVEGNWKFAIEHRDIIAKFGRFPHRNKVMGRLSSPAEDEFLKTGPRFGQ